MSEYGPPNPLFESEQHDPKWSNRKRWRWLHEYPASWAYRLDKMIEAERELGRQEGMKECEPLMASQYDLGGRDGL